MMKNESIVLAERIASHFLQEKVKAAHQIVGKGFVNQVCVVETEEHNVIVRMNDKDQYPIFLKERWCLEQAAAVGVPGPETLSVGIMEETAYMIQTVVQGDNGLDATIDTIEIWRKLGEYAKRIHSIPVAGFGERMDPVSSTFYSPPHAGSDGSWQGYIQYNINSLTEHDPLIELGVLTQAESKRVRQWFERLKMETFRFGLCHGDLSLKNTMVDLTGQITLLDWGNAEVTVVPYGDIIHMIRCQIHGEGPNRIELEAFMESYGLNEYELDQMRHVMVLKTFDTLRWAIDQSPDEVDFYAGMARKVLTLVKEASRDGSM
ncbi:Neomycin-kanamycin phosphotransferase type V [Paenibacillus illinoisensis]|uniref:Neomycin-kanamycin phosphotransferase type V n=2 Tax=Paenibacillus illinoisensis TaxID=59845 RepID=A0A2W0CLA1_9BACL|nr:Neomycin-kanamycin phosphotransferase type V [Paenibacillus illinoisensis]